MPLNASLFLSLTASPLKKGEKSEIWTWDLYKTTLPITCGDKIGTLHRVKLAEGTP